jgi:hypothetical protein
MVKDLQQLLPMILQGGTGLASNSEDRPVPATSYTAFHNNVLNNRIAA